MTNHEAYDKGHDAYWEGVDVSDNPYNREQEANAHLAWTQGWGKARDDDYDESDG
jgi:hypothetical protein